MLAMDNILIVGDGNFSFSIAFARSLLLSNEIETFGGHNGFEATRPSSPLCPACKIYATSYDSESVIRQNENAWTNVLSLKSFDNVYVHHGIDATRIDEHFTIKFNKIIFNFPHVGGKSNINACKKLLSDFFLSAASSIDDNGKVFVSLCKGQGGTPCDSGRKGYGNSWQIVTQASKAGFVLVEINPFNIDNITAYTTAGYRGQLGKGFHKKGSLTHVFIKNDKIQLPIAMEKIEFKDATLLIRAAEEYFEEKLKLVKPYTNDSHPLYVMIEILKTKLDNIFSTCLHRNKKRTSNGTGERSLEDKLNDLTFCKGNGKDIQSNINYYSNSNWNAEQSFKEMARKSIPPFYFTETFINPVVDLSPDSYPIYNELVVAIPGESFESLHDFADNISDLIDIIAVKNVKTSHPSYLRHESCDKSSYKTCECPKLNHYDPSIIPNFLSDINMKAWFESPPEVTISSEKNMDFGTRTEETMNANELVVQYRNVNYKDYIFSERESEYLSKPQQSFRTILEEDSFNEKAIDFCIDEVVVAKCGIEKSQENVGDGSITNQSYVAVIRIDQLCMKLLKVDDIRLFWSTDDVCLKELKNRLVNRAFFAEAVQPSILYPLCFRHDLCFWMTNTASEKVLFAAIRLTTKEMVHSVRLLRILRHEETNSLSYCYRFIYSRCDGPLSHKETVALQNALRLVLINLGLELR